MDPKKITQLKEALARLILFVPDALAFVQDANIDPTMITWGSSPKAMWNNIVNYAELNQQLYDLVEAVRKKYPKDPHLLAFLENKVQDYSLGPKIDALKWNDEPDTETLEKIMGAFSTLLPINFLTVGLSRAKSVGRIEIPRGDNRIELGTGFLLSKNLLLTNNHVLPDKDSASTALVKFNYELSADGNPYNPTAFSLDPDSAFFTKAGKTDDWSLVRVKGDANKDFGNISLSSDAEAMKNDFVNIIQHPAGRYKEIGLYHNVVTYADGDIVQYLTDTEPGSSGSPVFNSKWDLVALHHSGGMLREPNSRERLMRNEGIAIKKVRAGILQTGVFN
jgi:V8-like Glu-specific endopeptidase